jgi:SagB-type dehydrogenase family enzyme
MATMRSPALAAIPLGKRTLPPALAFMRPRFLREAVAVTTKNEMVIDGTSRLQILRGKSVRILPGLLALMDGTRTLQQLENALPGVPAEHVRAATTLLFDSGLIEDGIADTSDLAVNQETLNFFRRYVGVTRSNRAGQEAYERLQTSNVAIIGGPEGYAEKLQMVLRKTGVGRVVTLDRQSCWERTEDVAPARSLVVSLAFGCEDSEWHGRLDEWCSERQLAWLRVQVDNGQNYADLGPLFTSQSGFCYRCFIAVHGSPSFTSNPELRKELRAPGLDFWLSMAAVEVTYFLSQVAPLVTGRDFQRYDLRSWIARRLRCPIVPGCPRCRPLGQAASSTNGILMDTASVFEDCVSLPSLDYAAVREPMSATQSNVALTLESKRLSNCVQFPLPKEMPRLEYGSLDVLRHTWRLPTTDASRPITCVELAIILMMTSGIRELHRSTDNGVKRWGATGGNLGSVELYVAVRDVEGLLPGFYFYQAREHVLALFQRREGALELDTFMRRVLSADLPTMPSALLIFTGAYHRLSRKYGAFGYRLVNLDAGVALSQMHLVSRSLGVQSDTALRWADDLIEEQLNLEPRQEQCTAVVSLSGHGAAYGPSGIREYPLPPKQPASSKSPRAFCELPVQELAHMVCAESRLREEALGQAPYQIPSFLVGRNKVHIEHLDTQQLDIQCKQTRAISLPKPAQGGRLVIDILSRRHSTRHYATEPLTLEQLSTMLHLAHSEDAFEWSAEHAAGLPLTFLALAWNVEGLEPAVYRYEPQRQGVVWMRASPTRQSALELFPQPEFAAAPLVVWSFGNLAAACSRYGAFGHRQLLLRGGAACHRLWLSAMAMGLAGCLVAGVVPGAARRQFGVDGYTEASLLAFAVGYGAQAAK